MQDQSAHSGIQHETPLMRQYFEIKQEYPEALLLFQVGDFYELFFDDARKAAAYLGITLTARGKSKGEPIPLCGVPVHTLDHYLIRLVKGGFRVALCDQLEVPKPGTVVRRGVTRVFTPATLTDESLLDARSASYLLSCVPSVSSCGLLFGELLTGQLYATQIPYCQKRLDAEVLRFSPDEILCPSDTQGQSIARIFQKSGYRTTAWDDLPDHAAQAHEWLEAARRNAGQESASIFGSCPELNRSIINFYTYLKKHHEMALSQFRSLHFYSPEEFLQLDAATARNLELVANSRDGGRENTLFEVMDGATTPMGSRAIKKWIMRPTVSLSVIESRLDAVQELVNHVGQSVHIKKLLSLIGDLERIVGRIALKRAPLSDYYFLKTSLNLMPTLFQALSWATAPLLRSLAHYIIDFSELVAFLDKAFGLSQGTEITLAQGFDQRLDQLRYAVQHGGNLVSELERKEIEATGIASLKIRYNQVHGYYIEVTKTHSNSLPDYYTRTQTLVGKERYTTPELKVLAADSAGFSAQLAERERELFVHIQDVVAGHTRDLRRLTQALATLDALVGFSTIAHEQGYCRPEFHESKPADDNVIVGALKIPEPGHSRDIIIEDGRHPVVERRVSNRFIPNTLTLTSDESLWIITGPNMGGKSTFLRQNALICIMAHCGSFVPARKVRLPLLDRIFTRIGAGDNVADGKSTFLVEMEETAAICTQATSKSLVILDEVGRGTSTIDGMALAQAVIEYLITHVKARTLFATHYHELTQLSDRFCQIASYHAASKRDKDQVILLHKILKGVADGSFGIEVAKMAELPPSLIARAAELIDQHNRVEHSLLRNSASLWIPGRVDEPVKPSVDCTRAHEAGKVDSRGAELIAQLQSLDLDNLSPRQALDFVWQLKAKCPDLD